MDSSRGGPRSVVLLGSTGSIGTQAIDVIRRNPGRFRIAGLAAGGGNPGLLASQAIEFGAEVVAVERGLAAAELREALRTQGARPHPKVLAGPDGVAEAAAWPCDVVLNAVTGFSGLAATLTALRAGRVLALANKESLIAGGPLVAGLARPGQIVPVDSEHSAIAQCLRGGAAGEVARLVLTASGGPFLHRSRAELEQVTPEQALAHPTWNIPSALRRVRRGRAGTRLRGRRDGHVPLRHRVHRRSGIRAVGRETLMHVSPRSRPPTALLVEIVVVIARRSRRATLYMRRDRRGVRQPEQIGRPLPRQTTWPVAFEVTSIILLCRGRRGVVLGSGARVAAGRSGRNELPPPHHVIPATHPRRGHRRGHHGGRHEAAFGTPGRLRSPMLGPASPPISSSR